MTEETQATPKAIEPPATAASAPAQGADSPEAEAPAPAAPKAPKKPAPHAKVQRAPARTAGAEAVAKEGAEKPAPVRTAVAKPTKKAARTEAPTPAEPPKPTKAKKLAVPKPKLVRDSFTLPADDYALFASLKQRALQGGVEVKKSELLRAGLAMLARADDASFLAAVGGVERIKTGRPKK
jgi:hypothetical protein